MSDAERLDAAKRLADSWVARAADDEAELATKRGELDAVGIADVEMDIITTRACAAQLLQCLGFEIEAMGVDPYAAPPSPHAGRRDP